MSVNVHQGEPCGSCALCFKSVPPPPPPPLTCGVWLAVVLSTVLQLDGREAQRLHHLVRPLAPVGGAERRDGQGEGQRREGQGQQGAVTSGHILQHGCLSTQDRHVTKDGDRTSVAAAPKVQKWL